MMPPRTSDPRIRRKSLIAQRTTTPIPRPPIRAIAPPLIPIITPLLRRLQRMTLLPARPDLRRSFLTFQDLQRQSEGGVIRDVAMCQPGAGVVGLEGDHDVPVGGEEDDVAAGRVGFGEVEAVRECGVFDLLGDGEVVAVEVDLGCVSGGSGVTGLGKVGLQGGRRKCFLVSLLEPCRPV